MVRGEVGGDGREGLGWLGRGRRSSGEDGGGGSVLLRLSLSKVLKRTVDAWFYPFCLPLDGSLGSAAVFGAAFVPRVVEALAVLSFLLLETVVGGVIPAADIAAGRVFVSRLCVAKHMAFVALQRFWGVWAEIKKNPQMQRSSFPGRGPAYSITTCLVAWPSVLVVHLVAEIVLHFLYKV